MSDQTPDLARLETLAQQATPGHWRAITRYSTDEYQTPYYFVTAGGDVDDVAEADLAHNAAHIAACSPDAILAIIAWAREQQARAEAAEALLSRMTVGGLNVDVLSLAYGWTLDADGSLLGLTAGDQCYEPTGIVIDDFHKYWVERDALAQQLANAQRVLALEREARQQIEDERKETIQRLEETIRQQQAAFDRLVEDML